MGVFKAGETPEGVADLSGNVWEWTMSDYYSEKRRDDFAFDAEMQEIWKRDDYDAYIKKLKDKNAEFPVIRGGSWYNEVKHCRCAFRDYDNPVYRINFAGFRCARTLTL